MNKTSIRTTLAGFIGGVAFIIGCGGGGGGGSTNSAVANTTAQVQDIEEMYCVVRQDGSELGPSIHGTPLSDSLNSHYASYVTTTYANSYPNHRVFCATLGATSFTETTLVALEQGGWKTYNAVSELGYRSKVWRAVLR